MTTCNTGLFIYNNDYIPTNVKCDVLGPSELKLSWDHNIAVPVVGYRVYRSYTHDQQMHLIATTVNSTYIDSGVEENRTYFYRITSLY